MKLPVMIQVFRDADAELLRWKTRSPCTWSSVARGRLAFEVDKADDSDSTLYGRVGRPASVRDLPS